MRVVRDRQTGELRAPTPEELQDMIRAEQSAGTPRRGPATAAEAQPLQVRQHASGMKSAVLGPEYLISVQAQRDADGKLAISHEDPEDEHPAPQHDLPTE